MSDHPDLPYEQAKNKEYLEKVDAKMTRNPLAQVVSNVMWIDAVDHQIKAAGYHHPLLGRVGCNTEDESLRDFYIGSRYVQDSDIQVYSWAAPIARLFFQPCSGGDVAVRRTYTHHVDEIAALDDEWALPGLVSPFQSRTLAVPSPSSMAARRPRRALPLPPAMPVDADTSDADSHTPLTERFADGMRAKDAVLRRLSAPRHDRLMSVLALLQPDQHELVSWPVDRPLVVQGHPGSGKTVVAAYRAAYLVNPALYEESGELKDRRRPLRVLLVGPTRGYVAHVRDLIRPLAPKEQVEVTDISELMERTTGLKSPFPGGIGGVRDAVDAQAGRLTAKAARMLEQTGGLMSGTGAPRSNVKAVYELTRANGRPQHPLTEDPDLIAWSTKLPAFEQATSRRYLALIAQCRLAYKPIPETDRFDHIVIDEAQDVSPIEWSVLDHYLRRDGQWTLVGDMNQRRSDTTYASWAEIADHLALEAESGKFAPELMVRGYRSTGAILRFADKLLPLKARGNQSIQGPGAPVHVQHVTTHADLHKTGLQFAVSLAKKYEDGTTAMITVDPGSLLYELGTKGWRRTGTSHNIWAKDGLVLRLYVPEDARGLEFDAVVVIEPGAFPENLGRAGQLYTSLTRANRELSVVWHQDLPDPLRRAGRS